MSTPNKGVSKIIITQDGMKSLSKTKKQKTPRQMLLGAIMKHASGDRGEAMCEAFAKGKTEELREMMDAMTNAVVKKAARN